MPRTKKTNKSEKEEPRVGLSVEQIRARRADDRQEAAVAWKDYLTEQDAFREKTARLRAARLRRERAGSVKMH